MGRGRALSNSLIGEEGLQVIPSPFVGVRVRGLFGAKIEMGKVFCQIAKDKEEILQCYRIRHEVFVLEQKLFKRTDKDKFDKDTIHILAKSNDEIIGTVRIFNKKNGIWFGGRLAVLKKARRGDASKLLVKKAVEIAKRKKAKKFLAWVQQPNINFFLRLGWKKIDKTKNYLGKPHQLMEADLF